MNYPETLRECPIGSKSQRKDGNVYVKTEGGTIRLSRHIAALSDKVINGGRDLDEYDRVCHIDNSLRGEDGYDDPKNLVVIRVNRERVKFFRSRVIFVPSDRKRTRDSLLVVR